MTELRSAAKDVAGFDLAMSQIRTGLQTGCIRNAELQDAKFVLGRVVEDAWDKLVQQPYFREGRWKLQPEPVQHLHDQIMILCLHDVLATAKKIKASAETGPVMEAMRLFVSEALPLAQAVASLKDKVIKGRAPSAKPNKPVNANKLMGTCSVCFRPIAVVDGKMAHHGYKRLRPGFQSSSCSGVSYGPLEVTDEGLAWLVAHLREKLKGETELLNGMPKRTVITRTSKIGGKFEMVSFNRESPQWSAEYRRLVNEFIYEIDSIKSDLRKLEPMLANWKAQPWPQS